MSAAAWRGISHRQIVGIVLGLVLAAGVAFVALLVAFESVESERGRDIQLDYGERQLSTVRAAALDAERLARTGEAVERERLATRIEAAADSIETVQGAVLEGAAGAGLRQATGAYVFALRALTGAAPGGPNERQTLTLILAAATGDLRAELVDLAARLRLERDAAREQGQRLRMAVLIAVIAVVAAGLILMYRRRLRHGAAGREPARAEQSTASNPLTQAIESMSEGARGCRPRADRRPRR